MTRVTSVTGVAVSVVCTRPRESEARERFHNTNTAGVEIGSVLHGHCIVVILSYSLDIIPRNPDSTCTGNVAIIDYDTFLTPLSTFTITCKTQDALPDIAA